MIIIIVGSGIAHMSAIRDTPGAPDYYPGYSTAAITALSHFKELIPARYPSLWLSVADQCFAK